MKNKDSMLNAVAAATTAVALAVVVALHPGNNTAAGGVSDGVGVPTFSEHIAKILYANCTVCHRAGEIGAFPLASYEDAAAHAAQIAEATGAREMPPWKADVGYGAHADIRRLSDDEIALIRDWAEGGAPEGDRTKAPSPPDFPDGSQLGRPDLVLRMSEPYLHKGNGKDMYRCFVIPTGLLENKDIAAIEFRAGNKSIVHHALMFLDTTGKGREMDAKDSGPGYTCFGGAGFDVAATYIPWVPGATTRLFPQGLVGKMYRNSDLIIQIHYAPTDADQLDQSSVNIFFAKPSVFPREVLQFPMSPAQLDVPFVIPANQKKRFVARYKVPLDVSLLSVAPHMHLLGKEMKAYGVTPSGDTMPFVWIRQWDFHWQGAYTFKKIVKVPANTTLVVESEYDNTSDNPENPNSPPRVVRWGESTLDEMMLCYFFYTIYLPGDENIDLETKPVSAAPVLDRAAALGLECAPNPARGEATIGFTLPAAGRGTLTVHDPLGRIVRVVADGYFDAGSHVVPITISNTGLASGVYFCRLVTEHGSLVRAIRFEQ